MPSAGAVAPPIIVPLRKPVPGVPSTHIDTTTYIDLESETPGSRIYFTTDGIRPNPFQLKVAGKESTFRFRGSFTLKAGKRTLKTIAVSRDGLQESNVVTKTFIVDDATADDGESLYDDLESVDSQSWGTSKKKKTRQNKSARRSGSKQAWDSGTEDLNNGFDSTTPYTGTGFPTASDSFNSAEIPDGPFNPTNYSGTQMNFWGAAPANMPTPGMASSTSYPSQLGYLTNNMLRNLDQPKMSVADLRNLLNQEKQKEAPPPISQPDPKLHSKSPGGGDWRGQLDHIHHHLLLRCQLDIRFRTALAEPHIGEILSADFDEEDDAFLLTVSLSRPGKRLPPPKPKPTPQPQVQQEPPPRPKPQPPKPQPPKPKLKTVAKIVSAPAKKEPEKPKAKPAAPKPKPKAKPEPKAKPKPEAYFETEEYESDFEESPPDIPPPSKPKQKTSEPPVSPGKSSSRSNKSSTRSNKSSQSNKALSRSNKSSQKSSPNSSARKAEEKLNQQNIFLASEINSSEEESDKDSIYDDWPTHPYYLTEDYKQEGTLKPWPSFSAEIDCERLRKSMKGIGTDEKTIIDILGYRNASQRIEDVSMFKTMFGKDLKEELKSETSGNFKDALKALCLPPDEYDASEIKRAVKGLGTDEDALIEILCTRTNAQITAMNTAYEKLYNKEMEVDVAGDTSHNLKKLLVSQCQGNRDESPTFDRTAAKADAQALYDAGEAKWGTDESTFNMILCQRSYAHLRATFDEYTNISSKDIEDAIKSEFSGDIKNGYLTVVRCIREKPGYFAKKLQKAMKGLGSDDQALVRVIVSRSESDMVQIKAAFERDFGGTLADWIRDDTSGDYRELLLALIGERAPPVATAEEVEEAEAEPELEEIEEEDLPADPTVVPADPFDPQKDCEVLKKAMKGFGTDETAIINVMAKRSNEQRLELVKMYKTMYGKDLAKELKSETSGNFKNLLVGLCQSPPEFDANELRKAMKGIGTDEDCLIEILCTRSTAEMAEIVDTYNTIHGRNLEDDIVSETSGHLKRLLVSLVQANRPEGNTIDRRKCRKDAQDLFDAGENKWGTDESRFNVILCARSYAHLRATFDEYEGIAGKDIEASIKSETSGDLQKGYLTIVRTIRDGPSQFAKTLQKSMKGLGTDDDSLVRTVLTRCEREMVQIKAAFEREYNGALGKWIADDTSGDYRTTLLILTAEEQYDKKKRK